MKKKIFRNRAYRAILLDTNIERQINRERLEKRTKERERVIDNVR